MQYPRASEEHRPGCLREERGNWRGLVRIHYIQMLLGHLLTLVIWQVVEQISRQVFEKGLPICAIADIELTKVWPVMFHVSVPSPNGEANLGLTR